jgi:O-antigen ligase
MEATRASAAHDGHRLAIELLLLAAAGAAVALALAYGERRVVVHRRFRRAYAALLVIVLAVGVVSAFVHFGGPASLVRKTYHSLNATTVSSPDLNKRLFNISSRARVEHWSVAWHEYQAHPWLGTSGGTYEQYWMKNRPISLHVRNAHSLYLETLATLGPIGLALLLIFLGAPVFAAIRARRSSFVSAAFGAYVAYLAHAAIDWDWQLPAVTLAALACGVAVLVAARSEFKVRVLGMRVRVLLIAAALILFGAAFVGLRGNLAIAASNNAAADSNWRSSASQARDAKRWMPWSSDPWRLQGEAQYVLGDFDAARANFRKAIDKDPNNWLLWADLATVGTHGTWRAPARRALQLNPLAPELAEFRKALGGKG